jgi:hypothetical protein
MSKDTSSKTRLLLGASTLLLTSTAAMAQNIRIDSAVSLSADSAQSQDLKNNGDVEATTMTSMTFPTGDDFVTTTTYSKNQTSVGTLTDSSATVDNNSNRAIALGNTGTQSLSDADSAATETSVALGSKQLSAGPLVGEFQDTIFVRADAGGSEVSLITSDVSGSSATLSNATNAAIATTNTASQTVLLKSTTLENTGAPATNTDVNTTDAVTNIAGDVAVGSVQATTYSRTDAQNTSSTFTLTAASDVSDSALKLISNTQDASATGSTATNAVSLSATTVNIGAAIVSQQSSYAAQTDVSAATIAGIRMNVVNPTEMAASDVTASSAMVSGNRIQAKASGGVTSNILAVDATTLTGAIGLTTSVAATTTAAASNSAFTVANQQVAGRNAVQAGVYNSDVGFRTDGVTSGSSVAVEGNAIDAFGLSNKSTNSLSLAGTSVATDAGVINRQSADAYVSASAEARVSANFYDDISDSSVAVNSNVVRGSAIGNVGNNSLSASATTLAGVGTDAQAVSTGAITGAANATGDFSLVNSQALGENSSSNVGVYGSFDINAFMAVVTDSRLSVSANTQFAEALGNSGTNRIALTATGAGSGPAVTSGDTPNAIPAGVNPTAALSNAQDGVDARINSQSNMTVYANAESTGSSVAINGNSNTALGVVNNAVNSMSVSAVTLDRSAVTLDSFDANLAASRNAGSIIGDSNTTTADYALNSVQGASGEANVFANSQIYYLDKTPDIRPQAPSQASTGTVGSVITLSGNTTMAEGSANRISNQLSVSAIDNGATAALNNFQTSSTNVTSTATSSVGYALGTSATDVSADASSISVDSNSTMALARGNTASNALNYTVGASYTGNDGAFVTASKSLNATAAVLNNQINGGPVSATSADVTYSLALNATTPGVPFPSTGDGAFNSNATLANNSATASAFGNTASNSLNMLTFGAGVPSSALASNQVNTGAVSATAANVSFGMTVGTTQGSALRNVGNNTTAQAVGNSSVNSINGGN